MAIGLDSRGYRTLERHRNESVGKSLAQRHLAILARDIELDTRHQQQRHFVDDAALDLHLEPLWSGLDRGTLQPQLAAWLPVGEINRLAIDSKRDQTGFGRYGENLRHVVP